MSYLHTNKDSSWLHLTLDRVDKKNALNLDLIKELTQSLSYLGKDIKGVVLKGEGSCFCAGADLNWIHKASPNELEKLFNLFQTIESCPVPTLAYAHGTIFGGGIGLLSVCDFVLAHTETTFCFSELKLGLMPALIAPFVLKVSPSLKTYMLTGSVFNTTLAFQNHLVHFVGSKKECQDRQTQLIQDLNLIHLPAFQETKEFLKKIPSIEPGALLVESIKCLMKRQQDVSAQDKIKALLNKKHR